MLMSLVFAFLCGLVSLCAADDMPSCVAMNDLVDSVLNGTNVQIDESYDTYHILAYSVQQNVDLYAFGLKLPFAASLDLTNGRVGRLNSLSRYGNVLNCSTSDMRTLQGVYKYDELSVSYDMTATVLRWKFAGKFIYRVQPYLAIGIVKGVGPSNCNLEVFETVNADPSEYEITVENTWFGSLVGKLLRHSLKGVENEPMLGNMLQISVANVNGYLGLNVCETIWKGYL